MRVYLEYLGDAVELPLGETVIGRDVGCTLRFNDPAVSRRHLKIIRRADDVFVEDLGSSNGTIVNGRPLTGAALVSDRDRIVIGTRELAIQIPFEDEEEPVTLNLLDLSAAAEGLRSRTTTTKLPAQVMMNQRCPRCGAPVHTTDDECANCHYQWGSFRPAATTDIGNNPLRKHERIDIELHVLYSSADLEIEATTRDLSIGGLFVCTQVLEPLGTTCDLTLLVDGGPPLVLKGVVRRVVEHEDGEDDVGLGIELLNVGETEKQWLAAISRRS
ncbi:MAG TPA: FHA domain-containing protein [Kofleriaceae bacterium]